MKKFRPSTSCLFCPAAAWVFILSSWWLPCFELGEPSSFFLGICSLAWKIRWIHSCWRRCHQAPSNCFHSEISAPPCLAHHSYFGDCADSAMSDRPWNYCIGRRHPWYLDHLWIEERGLFLSTRRCFRGHWRCPKCPMASQCFQWRRDPASSSHSAQMSRHLLAFSMQYPC